MTAIHPKTCLVLAKQDILVIIVKNATKAKVLQDLTALMAKLIQSQVLELLARVNATTIIY